MPHCSRSSQPTNVLETVQRLYLKCERVVFFKFAVKNVEHVMVIRFASAEVLLHGWHIASFSTHKRTFSSSDDR